MDEVRHILFKCECGDWFACIERKADGRRCSLCNGYAKAVGKFTIEELREMLRTGEITPLQDELLIIL